MTFQTIPTRIDSSSELFATNTTAYQELVATLRERQQIAIDGGHGREARWLMCHLLAGAGLSARSQHFAL